MDSARIRQQPYRLAHVGTSHTVSHSMFLMTVLDSVPLRTWCVPCENILTDQLMHSNASCSKG